LLFGEKYDKRDKRKGENLNKKEIKRKEKEKTEVKRIK
jgi:hypothetical protein